MGRRSTHTPEQLRTLILDAAQALIEEKGLSGLSAREIARRIGYSPGTIYNMYQNLDDVVLRVEARVLEALDEELSKVVLTGQPDVDVSNLAHCYHEFTNRNRRLWNLLFEHFLPEEVTIPEWYQQRLEGPMQKVETAIAPLFGPHEQGDCQRCARVLWASVHGITSLASTDKLTTVTTDAASTLINDLVGNYMRGLMSRASSASPRPV